MNKNNSLRTFHLMAKPTGSICNLACKYCFYTCKESLYPHSLFEFVIGGKGEMLVNCLAYTDLNPLRTGLVYRPEEYRWNSYGYHLQTENKDRFLHTDYGL